MTQHAYAIEVLREAMRHRECDAWCYAVSTRSQPGAAERNAAKIASLRAAIAVLEAQEVGP